MKPATSIVTLFVAAVLLTGALGLRRLNGGNNWADARLRTLYGQLTPERKLFCRSQIPPGAALTDPRQGRCPAGASRGPRSGSGLAKRRTSCASQKSNQAGRCREIERAILAATLRLEIELWRKRPTGPANSGLYAYTRDQGNGHGTIRAGRYLVTHNHFDLPLPAPGESRGFDYGRVNLYRADGERLAVLDLANAFIVVDKAPETLVLDFGAVAGQGFFTALGLPSAPFTCWQKAALRPGMAVAQLDWDGRRAVVKWVSIREIVTGRGTPRLVLDSGLTPGASGGGVFWNGAHIATNWQLIERYDRGGELAGEQSAAALN